ncbi:hypothetical protein FKP32DRAFT_1592781 [Trametes sanguinea]|nr:hypothetical protein FKP32DRAFT_1592781 [Trametes sanguinea]
MNHAVVFSYLGLSGRSGTHDIVQDVRRHLFNRPGSECYMYVQSLLSPFLTAGGPCRVQDINADLLFFVDACAHGVICTTRLRRLQIVLRSHRSIQYSVSQAHMRACSAEPRTFEASRPASLHRMHDGGQTLRLGAHSTVSTCARKARAHVWDLQQADCSLYHL